MGNLINRLLEQRPSPAPEIGMGVTELCWSDRHAWTILEVWSPSRVTIQRDKAICVGKRGLGVTQQYRFERDAAGGTKVLTKRRDGVWREMGVGKGNSNTFVLGERSEYEDPSI